MEKGGADKLETMSLDQLKNKLQEWLSDNNYSENTVKGYLSEFSQLESFLKDRNINDYSVSMGVIYKTKREQTSLKPRTRTHISRSILVWNMLLDDSDIPNRRCNNHKWKKIPSGFETAVHSFMNDAMSRCNKRSRLEEKGRVCSSFFNILSDLGCTTCDQLNANTVLKAILLSESSWWSIIKLILYHLYDERFTTLDFSGLVPRDHKTLKIPDVYSKEEIELAESTFDLNTGIGKRNFAIFKMASREALRSLDIALLQKSSIDFENNHLSIKQTKTKEDLDIPLFPDVKDALLDYIENGRPSSDSDYIFLRERAPYENLSRQNVYTIISGAIVEAGISVEGKRKGGHSLRASSATHKVNSGMRYDQVQKSMGHSGRESLKHYAALDVKCLRKCALSPPSVDKDSAFGRFLSGHMI